MKKFIKALVTVFFFVLPLFLLYFVSILAHAMRWQVGSPLFLGYNWMRWSHVYLVVGSLFCFTLYVPVILSLVKKNQKILLIPLFGVILFLVFSVLFAGVSRKVYYRQIIQEYDEEIKNYPNDSLPLEKKAAAYDQLGETQKAIIFYNQALGSSVNPAYVIHDRGLAYINIKEYNKAVDDFTEAIKMRPDELGFVAQCYNDRGVAYFRNGQYAKSWQDASKAMNMGYKVHPGFLAALAAKGYKQ